VYRKFTFQEELISTRRTLAAGRVARLAFLDQFQNVGKRKIGKR